MPGESGFPFTIFANITTETVLWVLLLVAVSVFLVHAVVVAYHWYSFGTERSVASLSTTIYVAVGLVLLLGMSFTLLD